jgi:HK97 gp10 family phage protein
MKGNMTLNMAPFLEDLVAAGADIDQVVQEVLSGLQEPVKEEMRANLKKTSETWTGAAESTLFADPVAQDGNYSFVKFGADTSKDPAALYKEYGTARQAAEPFFRPTMTWARKQIRAGLKEVMKRMGLEV